MSAQTAPAETGALCGGTRRMTLTVDDADAFVVVSVNL